MNQTRDQLPWPWETKYSSTTGVPYYYNRSNGESTWQHPMQDRGFSTPRQYPRTTHTNESHRQPITSTDAHRSHSDHRNWQERAHNHATPPQPRHSATAIQPSHRSPRDPGVGGPGSVRHGSSHQLRGPEDRFSESPPRRPYTARSGDPAASGGPAGTDGLLWASPRDRGGRPPFGVPAAAAAAASRVNPEIARLQAGRALAPLLVPAACVCRVLPVTRGDLRGEISGEAVREMRESRMGGGGSGVGG